MMKNQLQLPLPNALAARDVLFMNTNDQPFVTSRAVAERFGKRHDNVLKRIKKLIEELNNPEFSQLHLEAANYIDEQGKTRLEYHLSHDGFALVVMGFTGAEALEWKIAFITAFNQMEAELRARTQRFANALDNIRPYLRPVVEGTEQGLSRAEIGAALGKSPASVTYHRRVARCNDLFTH